MSRSLSSFVDPSVGTPTEPAVSQPIVLTFDVDWAADFMIDAVSRELIERRVKSTWLVTHASPAIERLRERPDLFELGIHPNFLDGSSHGESVEEILATCMSIVPEATTMRSHALVQSSPILSKVVDLSPIRCDSSLMLPGVQNLAPFRFPHEDGPLVRVPYFWEDDVEMMRPRAQWDLAERGSGGGLRIYDFHPVHVFLNAASMAPYHKLKLAGPLTSVSAQLAASLVHSGPGVGSLFREIADHLAEQGSQMLRDVAAAYRQSGGT